MDNSRKTQKGLIWHDTQYPNFSESVPYVCA